MAHFLCVSHLPQLVAVGGRAGGAQTLQSIFGDEAQVRGFATLPAALDWLADNTADGLLLAHDPPGSDALPSLRALRAMPSYADLPIFICAGNVTADLLSRCLHAQATDVLPLPLDGDVLRRRIHNALHARYLQDNLTQEVGRQVKLAEERLDASRTLFKEMSLALAKAIDAKDKYTSGHSERVANYSRDIARRAGESELFQEKIYFIGLLHDVGKIGIPRYIINKPTRLSDEEYKKIKQHPVIGCGILQYVDVIPEFAIGAHFHHERYDGHGYPLGLKGDDIPKLARIIAVADAYDAMTSKRSYRDGLSQDVVRAEIARERGRQFDPQYADIMLAMIDEDTDFRMRESGVSPLAREAALQLHQSGAAGR